MILATNIPFTHLGFEEKNKVIGGRHWLFQKRRLQSWNVASEKYLGRKVHFSTPMEQPKFH